MERKSHEKTIGRPLFWTKTKILAKVRRGDTHTSFRKRHPGAYAAALRLDLMPDLDKAIGHSPVRTHTIETVSLAASHFSTRRRFMEGAQGAYHAAWKHGWLDVVCAHMEPPHRPARNKLCSYSVYIAEFESGAVYVGLSASSQERFVSHKSDERSSVYRYFLKTGLEPRFRVIAENMTVIKAQEMESVTIETMLSHGREVLNRVKAGGLGARRPYTNDEIIAISKRFDTPSEWKQRDGGSYNAAKKRNIFEMCVSHMTNRRKRFRTVEEAMLDGKRYATRSEWQKRSSQSYFIVRTAGRLDEVIPSRTVRWTNETAAAERNRYASISDFAKHAPGAYNYWKKNLRNRGDISSSRS